MLILIMVHLSPPQQLYTTTCAITTTTAAIAALAFAIAFGITATFHILLLFIIGLIIKKQICIKQLN